MMCFDLCIINIVSIFRKCIANFENFSLILLILSPSLSHPTSSAYTLNIKKQCLQHAILDQLKAPPAVFRDVIRAHFKHKQLSLREQLKEWSTEQPACKSLAASIEKELTAL